MSTRCVIAMKNPDQTVSGVYCHFDGYPDGVGKCLLDHYQDEEKVKALLALGSLSSLGERVAPEPGEEHSFERPVEGITVAYHRDRGEKLCQAQTWANQDIMLKKTPDSCWAEYCYLWAGSWYVGVCWSGKWYRLADCFKNKKEA